MTAHINILRQGGETVQEICHSSCVNRQHESAIRYYLKEKLLFLLIQDFYTEQVYGAAVVFTGLSQPPTAPHSPYHACSPETGKHLLVLLA